MPVEVQGFVALETTDIERLAQVGGLIRRGHLPSGADTGKGIPLLARIRNIQITANLSSEKLVNFAVTRNGNFKRLSDHLFTPKFFHG
jgi:hypothetical protein